MANRRTNLNWLCQSLSPLINRLCCGEGTLSGAINLNGHALTIAYGTTIVNGTISGNGSVTCFETRAKLTAMNDYSGPTTVVNGGSIEVDGAVAGPITLITDPHFGPSTVGGIGSVGDVTAHDYCDIFPRLAVGPFRPASTLTTGNLSLLSSTSRAFFSESEETHESIDVHGTVRLDGELYLITQSSETIRLGEQYILIANDGTDPVVGTFANCPEGGIVKFSAGAYRISYHGGDGNDVVATAITFPSYAVAAGASGFPQVNVYDGFGDLLRSFAAYPTDFHGGVHVVTADVNGDNAPDIITAPGVGGGPIVRIWDGVTGALLRQFNAYDAAFRGGVFLATADLYGDSHVDIITGAGPGGGPHVKAFDGVTFAERESFMAYDLSFRGGVSVAATSAYRTTREFGPGEIITGAGPGGGPHVKVFEIEQSSLPHATLFRQFMAYDQSFRGGINVAAHGQSMIFTGTTIVTAPASNGGPDVRMYDYNGTRVGGFFPYAASFFGGVTIAQVSLGIQRPDVLVTGAGPGGAPHIEVWELPSLALRLSFFAFDPAFIGGVYVG